MKKLLVLLLLVACNPQLSIVTPAPPNRIVRLDQEADRIELSEGVAMAVECYREGSPCKDVHATIDDGAIAKVFPAHMSKVTHAYGGQQNTSTLALVGLAPGKTKLHVTSESWKHDYEVTVLE